MGNQSENRRSFLIGPWSATNRAPGHTTGPPKLCEMYQQPPPSPQPHGTPMYVQQPQGSPVYMQQPQGTPMMMQSPAPVAYMPSPPIDDEPMMMTCPSCRNQVVTRTKAETGTCTWLSCVGLGCLTCCCCIPFFFDIFKDIKHSCPSCGAHLGTHKRI